MKRTAFILLGFYFVLLFNVNAQSKVGDAEKAIKDKDYNKALTIAKEVLDNESPSEALKLLIQLREKNIVDKRLYEYFGDAYSKMNVAELALTNYAQAESIDSLDVALKFKSAELLYQQKRYTDAVNKYLKIISIDPKNATAYVNAATILYQAKYYADAATLYEKYIAIDQTKEAYERLTKAFLETNNYEKAHNYAVEGLAKYPNDIILKKNAAISSFGLKKFDEAGKYYSSVPDSNLTVSDFVNAGRAFQISKSDSMAIQYFEKAIKKDSTLSSIYMDLANYNYLNKNYDLAVKYYQAKIKVDPNYEAAYRYMAFALLKEEKYEETRAALSKAVSLVDTTVATHYWLGQTYRQLDSLDQAAEQCQIILKLTNGRESQFKDEILDSNFFLGQRAFIKKNYAAAIPYLKRAYQLKPNEWRYTEMLGACYHQLQNFDEAISWYKTTLKLNPKSEIAKKGLRMLSAD